MWFERNRDKDHGDMTQNPTCVKITRSIFMNKKTISFRVYQANRLEQRAENQYVVGIIIIESSCSRVKYQLSDNMMFGQLPPTSWKSCSLGYCTKR